MRSLIAFLAVLFVSASAAFADVAGAVAQLDADCLARITAIGSPAATRADAKESKGLARAREKLATYTGQNSVAALKKLAAAGVAVLASGTEDAAILADIDALVLAFAEGGDRRAQLVADAKAQLIDPKHIAAVDAAVAIADKILDKGRGLIDRNPTKAAALLITAYDYLGRVVAKAQRLGVAEAGSAPPEGLSVSAMANSLSLLNTSPSTFDIAKIRVFAAVSTGGNVVKTYVGESAKSVIPGLYAVKGSNRVPAADANPAVFDLTDVLAGLVPLGTATPRVTGLFQVFLKGEDGFFVATFDVTLP
jgi:hypothetical protein